MPSAVFSTLSCVRAVRLEQQGIFPPLGSLLEGNKKSVMGLRWCDLGHTVASDKKKWLWFFKKLCQAKLVYSVVLRCSRFGWLGLAHWVRLFTYQASFLEGGWFAFLYALNATCVFGVFNEGGQSQQVQARLSKVCIWQKLGVCHTQSAVITLLCVVVASFAIILEGT